MFVYFFKMKCQHVLLLGAFQHVRLLTFFKIPQCSLIRYCFSCSFIRYLRVAEIQVISPRQIQKHRVAMVFQKSKYSVQNTIIQVSCSFSLSNNDYDHVTPHWLRAKFLIRLQLFTQFRVRHELEVQQNSLLYGKVPTR